MAALTRCPKCKAERTDGDFTCTGVNGKSHEPVESKPVPKSHWPKHLR